MQRVNLNTPLFDKNGDLDYTWQRALSDIDDGAFEAGCTEYPFLVSGPGVSNINGRCLYQKTRNVCIVNVNCFGFTTASTGTNVALNLPFAYTGPFGTNVYMSAWGTTGIGTFIPVIANLNPGSAQLLIYAGGNTITPYSDGAHSFAGIFTYPCDTGTD